MPVPNDVAVIIPTLNEEAHIGHVLADLDRQTVRPSEVHVIDGGSDDDTVAVVKGFRSDHFDVFVHHNPQRRVPHALNIGLSKSTAPLIARVDGHCRLGPEYLEGVVGALARGYSGAGGVKTAVGQSSQGRANAACLNSRFGVGSSPYHFASSPTEVRHVPFGAYPRLVLDELNGWDERFVVNQDFELDLRVRGAGGRLLVDPRSRIEWKCRESIGGLWRQYRRYGAGKARVHEVHPGSLSISQAAAILTPVAACCALLFGVSRSGRRLLTVPVGYLGVLLVQAALVRRDVARSPTSDRDQRITPIARLLASLATMQVGYSVGFWEGRLARRQHSSQVTGPDASSR